MAVHTFSNFVPGLSETIEEIDTDIAGRNATIQYQDEGVDVSTKGAIQYINFTGTGVTVTSPSAGVLVVDVPSSGGITIGSTAITSGTNDRILYQSGGVVSQSANLTFNATGLHVGNINIFDNGATYPAMFIGASPSGSYAGYFGTFLGLGAGSSHTGGNYSTFIGQNAGNGKTSGDDCTFIGAYAGGSGSQASNTFIGARAGTANTANGNTFIGAATGSANTSGANNNYLGVGAGATNSTGSGNSCFGTYAGLSFTGSNNTMVGHRAGLTVTGSGGVYLGANAGEFETASNKLYIANSSTSTPLIYGDFSTPMMRVHGNFYSRTTSGAQITAEYDGSNRAELTVDSSGNLTVNVSGSKVVFSDAVEVPDDPYNATSWNGSLEIPTKNAIRDKIETLPTAFIGLSDVPASYAGEGGKAVAVNVGETGLEFVAFPSSGSGLTQPQVMARSLGC